MSNQSPQAYHQHLQPPSFNDDEIDLKELFLALWKGKITIILCTLVFAIGAVMYALTAQEWWSSKAKIMGPQLHDMSEYQEQVKQYQPVFDVYQEDGTLLRSGELDGLVNPSALFKQFINAYNSSNNKKAFLDGSAEFQAFKKQLEADTETNTDTIEATRKLYAEWFEKINAATVGKEKAEYEISLQATTKESSYTLLNEYIALVKSVVFIDAFNNLQAQVDSKKNELTRQKSMLEAQAKARLLVEIERTRYALDIAKAAEVDKPLQNMGSNELFVIELGSKALEAKIKALESIKNLVVIEPRLQQVNAKLDMLQKMTVDKNIQFQMFRYIENVDQPLTRDKPKRALIAVLGTLLGGMLGVAIVLARFAFRKEESELETKN